MMREANVGPPPTGPPPGVTLDPNGLGSDGNNYVKSNNNWYYCSTHGYDVNHQSNNCPRPAHWHNSNATRMNPLGGSTKGKHKFLLPLPRRTCSPLQSNGQIHPPSQQPQAPINYQPPMSYQQPSYQQPSYQQPSYQQPRYQQPSYYQPNYQQPPQPPHYQPPQPPMNYQQQHHQQNGWSQPGHGWGN